MNILYISQYYPPEVAAGAVRVSELARAWVKAGNKVTVLTGFPNHPTGVVHPDYKRRIRRLFFREEVQGVDVVRTWLMPLPNRKSRERIINYGSFAFSAGWRGLFMHRPHVVIATSPPLTVGLTGWWLSKAKRAPFVFEVRDLWPESITAVGMGKSTSPFMRALARMALFLYRSADQVVAVTPAIRDEIVKKSGIPEDRASVVLNGVDVDLFSPSANGNRQVKKALGLDGKFVVSYIGTLGAAHGLMTMLEAAKALQPQFPQIEFLLVGEGADKANLVHSTTQMGLNNVRFLPLQPREKIPDIARASDVCLVLLRKADVFTTVLPTKMLEFMASGRAVVLGVDGQARKILEDAGGGLSVQPENVSELVQAIVRLHQDPALCSAMGFRGRNYVETHLSRAQTADEYLSLLEKVVDKRLSIRR